MFIGDKRVRATVAGTYSDMSGDFVEAIAQNTLPTSLPLPCRLHDKNIAPVNTHVSDRFSTLVRREQVTY